MSDAEDSLRTYAACLLFNCCFICVPQSSLGLSTNVTSASEYQFSLMSFWDFMWRFVSSAASGASLMCWCPLRLRVITGCLDKLNLIFTVSIVTACLSFFHFILFSFLLMRNCCEQVVTHEHLQFVVISDSMLQFKLWTNKLRHLTWVISVVVARSNLADSCVNCDTTWLSSGAADESGPTRFSEATRMYDFQITNTFKNKVIVTCRLVGLLY